MLVGFSTLDVPFVKRSYGALLHSDWHDVSHGFLYLVINTEIRPHEATENAYRDTSGRVA